jgi:transcriptional regulator with XRE-family HTH domain
VPIDNYSWRYDKMSPTPKQMGRNVKAWRKKRNLSRQALAEKAGVSREYVRKLEAGRYDPTVGTLGKLARALGVRVTELLK